jgi:hypothetical protein
MDEGQNKNRGSVAFSVEGNSGMDSAIQEWIARSVRCGCALTHPRKRREADAVRKIDRADRNE